MKEERKGSLIDYFRGESILGTSFVQVNAVIGVGIIYLPYILRDVGIFFGLFWMILGILIIIFFLFITYFALNASRDMLGEEERVESIEMLAKASFKNDFLKHLVYFLSKIICFVFLSGCIISFQIVMHEMLMGLLRLVFSNGWFDYSSFTPRLVVGGIVVVGLCLVSVVKRIRNMVCTSVISCICLVMLCLSMFILYVTGFTTPLRSGSVILFPDFFDYRSYLKTIKYGGILTFTNLNTTLSRLHSEFSPENLKKLPLIIIISYIIIFGLYFSCAFFGYLSFLDNTEQNVLLSYQGDEILQFSIAIFLRVIMFCQVFFTYPIIAFVHTQVSYEVLDLVIKKINPSEEGKNDKNRKILSEEKMSSRSCTDSSNTDDDFGVSSESISESSIIEISSEGDIIKTDERNDDVDNRIRKDDLYGKLGIDKRYILFTSITIINTIVVGLISIVYPKANNVMGYVGGIPGIILVIVLPAVGYLKLVNYRPWFGVVVVVVTVLSSVLLGVGSNIVQILEEVFGLDL